MAGDNYRFAESDSLLCYHGPMLYEAKCLKRRKTSDGKAQYFIHYKGWNSKWEEWVDDDRVLTVNTANMNKMASLKEIHSNSKKSGAKRSITTIKEETTRNVTPPIKGRKRKHSEISSESSQVVNVSSPAEPKPKKRGRPPKNTSSKIELNEVIETSDTVAITETVETTKLIEVPKVTRSLGANKIIAGNKVVEVKKVVEATKANEEAKVISVTNGVVLNKDVEKTELVELTEETKDIGITEVVKSAESIEGTKDVDMSKAFEISKSIEASKEVVNTKAFVCFSETEVIDAVGATDVVLTDGVTKTLEVVEALEANSAVNDASETESVIETVQSFEEKELPETIEEIKEAKTLSKPLKSLWILETNNITESIKEIEVETAKLNEEIEGTKTREIIEKFEGIKEIKEKKLIEESLERTETIDRTKIDVNTEPIEKTERVIFTVPAPVEKTLPIIRIPEILKQKIAHDFYMTVKLNKILKFPEKYTVEKLIRAYICSKSKADIQDYNLKYSIRHRSFNLGVTLMQYFNILIHSQLLYSKEKEYGLFKKAKACVKKKIDSDSIHHCFTELMYPNEFWHYVYSPTYLLRLFVFMPQLLMSSVYSNQDLAYFALNCEDFLKYFESKHELYFTNDDYK